MLNDTQEGINSLEHEIKCVASELDIRRSLKSKKTDELAKAILHSDINNNKFLYFGWQGLLLKALHFLFPIAIETLIKINRLVKNKLITNKSNL